MRLYCTAISVNLYGFYFNYQICCYHALSVSIMFIRSIKHLYFQDSNLQTSTQELVQNPVDFVLLKFHF